MNDERDRLEDLNIEEAVGRSTPPDLTDRILAAADKRELDEAVTPISGRHAVPRTHRPTGRRMTSPIARKNWQGAGIVTAFALLFAVGLVAFVLLNNPESSPEQDTAETQKTNETTRTNQNENQGSPQNRLNPDANDEQPTAPKSENEPEDKPEPENPDGTVDQPGPEPEPKDPVEQPKHEPKDTVEQPKPEQPEEDPVEPKPEPVNPEGMVEDPSPNETDEGDKTEAQPTPKAAVVASFPAMGNKANRYPYAVRNAEGKWDSDPLSAQKNDEHARTALRAGTELKISTAPIDLVNGAILNGDCVLSIDSHEDVLTINLLDDDFWVDSTGVDSRLRVRYEELTADCTGAAAVFEADGRKLQIRCAVGEVRCGTEIVRAGEQANLSGKGLSSLRPWDGRHKLREGAPSHTLHHVGFKEEPTNGLIEGKRIQLQDSDLATDNWVAYQSGADAKVSLQFDETIALQPGSHVVIRLRQRGGKKLILQFWNAEAADNFGVDLPAGEDNEWQVISLPIEKFKDRESGRVVAKSGDHWMSGGVYVSGENTDLYVDYIRIERKP